METKKKLWLLCLVLLAVPFVNADDIAPQNDIDNYKVWDRYGWDERRDMFWNYDGLGYEFNGEGINIYDQSGKKVGELGFNFNGNTFLGSMDN